ncbi:MULTISPECIES: hypothetical protein [Streptosporangium]|uniref:Uncharacterized protein n=1 Tax=Streptosporangium brasiliense TaxID=47480 RepID=A0ABT9RJG9_9ACTN|nr:hypothetical protein [Streptosporangium brasiliense]MDP9869400.1 hypothetical protein [Streptosporangium brasiliense]
MRKVLAAASTVLLTVLLTATPVQAAPKDPLTALRKQLAQGGGVSFTERSASRSGDRPTFERQGLLRYGKLGITASDITAKLNFEEEPKKDSFEENDSIPDSSFMKTPERIIRIGATSYTRGFIIGNRLPKGKVWWKQLPGWTSGVSAMVGDYINAADPGTLKVLLDRSKRSGNTYTGQITLKELQKVSPWARVTLWQDFNDQATAGWKLVVSSSGLPSRLTTYSPGEGNRKRSDIRYTSWGTKASITAPPAGKVTTKLEGDGRSPLPKAPRR